MRVKIIETLRKEKKEKMVVVVMGVKWVSFTKQNILWLLFTTTIISANVNVKSLGEKIMRLAMAVCPLACHRKKSWWQQKQKY